MRQIDVHMRDGSVREFKHKGRPGGSYTVDVKYKDGMVVIEDEYHNTIAIPMDLVSEVKTWPFY